MEQQRVETLHRPVAHQQLEHPVGESLVHAPFPRPGRRVRWRERLAQEHAGELVLHARLLVRQHDAVGRQHEMAPRGQAPRGNQGLRHVLEQGRSGLPGQALARFLARQARLQRMGPMVGAGDCQQRLARRLDRRRGDQALPHRDQRTLLDERGRNPPDLHGGAADAGRERADGHTRAGGLPHHGQDRLGVIIERVQTPQAFEAGHGAQPPARRSRIEHDASANRHHRRVGAQHETIAPGQGDRALQMQAREHRAAGLQHARKLGDFLCRGTGVSLARAGTCRADRQASHDLAGPLVKAYPGPVLQRPGAIEQRHPPVEPARRTQTVPCRESVPALQIVDSDGGQIDGNPLSRSRAGQRVAVHLQAAHLDAAAGRHQREFALPLDDAGRLGAGHHGPEALDAERTVDRQPGNAAVHPPGDTVRQCGELALHVVEPGPGARRHRHQRCAVEERAGDELAGLQADELQRLLVHQIGLGERHHTAPHPQETADVEMLAGLRHDRLVRRDDEQHAVDAAGAREHIADEPFVPRHVDERELRVAMAVRREPEVDRNPPGLFFLQPVRINPGQCLDQGALPVIDVACRADHEVLHGSDHRTVTPRAADEAGSSSTSPPRVAPRAPVAPGRPA